MFQVINKSRDVVLATNCEIADSFFARFCGLMLRKSLCKDNALLLKPCNSIHMLFMRFPIDVIFLNSESEVIGICHSIKPWRTSSVFWKAKSAIEFPAGLLVTTKTDVGDLVQLEELQA